MTILKIWNCCTLITAYWKKAQRWRWRARLPRKPILANMACRIISDISFADVKAEEYDALLVPGGWAPDKLRRFKEVIEITKHMHEHKKPIGQICHAGWVLISAKILQGVKCTSAPGIKDDMENAGAIWINEPAVADGHIISAQRPPDLPAYMRLFVECLAKK